MDTIPHSLAYLSYLSPTPLNLLQGVDWALFLCNIHTAGEAIRLEKLAQGQHLLAMTLTVKAVCHKYFNVSERYKKWKKEETISCEQYSITLDYSWVNSYTSD